MYNTYPLPILFASRALIKKIGMYKLKKYFNVLRVRSWHETLYSSHYGVQLAALTTIRKWLEVMYFLYTLSTKL